MNKPSKPYAGKRHHGVILPRGVKGSDLRERAIDLDRHGRDTELISRLLGVSQEVVRALVSEGA